MPFLRPLSHLQGSRNIPPFLGDAQQIPVVWFLWCAVEVGRVGGGVELVFDFQNLGSSGIIMKIEQIRKSLIICFSPFFKMMTQ